jgi:hypothetical protein
MRDGMEYMNRQIRPGFLRILPPAMLLSVMLLLAIPARASFSFTIVQITPTLNAGDMNDLMEVQLVNAGPAFSADAFSFQISTSDPDITFGTATSLTTAPYIFTADNANFNPIGTGSGQTLSALDFTADGNNVTVPVGTVGLGLVSFNIAAVPSAFSFTVDFTGPTAVNQLSDLAGDTFTPTTLASQDFTIQPFSVPEPYSAGCVGTVLVAIAVWRRKAIVTRS